MHGVARARTHPPYCPSRVSLSPRLSSRCQDGWAPTCSLGSSYYCPARMKVSVSHNMWLVHAGEPPCLPLALSLASIRCLAFWIALFRPRRPDRPRLELSLSRARPHEEQRRTRQAPPDWSPRRRIFTLLRSQTGAAATRRQAHGYRTLPSPSSICAVEHVSKPGLHTGPHAWFIRGTRCIEMCRNSSPITNSPPPSAPIHPYLQILKEPAPSPAKNMKISTYPVLPSSALPVHRRVRTDALDVRPEGLP